MSLNELPPLDTSTTPDLYMLGFAYSIGKRGNTWATCELYRLEKKSERALTISKSHSDSKRKPLCMKARGLSREMIWIFRGSNECATPLLCHWFDCSEFILTEDTSSFVSVSMFPMFFMCSMPSGTFNCFITRFVCTVPPSLCLVSATQEKREADGATGRGTKTTAVKIQLGTIGAININASATNA